MKKLLFVLLVATTLVSCTKSNVEEDNYDNETQLIDKKDAQIPPNRKKEKIINRG